MTTSNVQPLATQPQPVISVAPSVAVTLQLPITEKLLLKAVDIGGSPAVLLTICFAGSVALIKTVLSQKKQA